MTGIAIFLGKKSFAFVNISFRYRDGGTNHHTSILSLPESYEAGDLNYYDTFSKNMDANLAEADMESFRTEDIHALLTNLPPMCTDHLSQEVKITCFLNHIYKQFQWQIFTSYFYILLYHSTAHIIMFSKALQNYNWD